MDLKDPERKVLNAVKHPDADRLKVCEVETIQGTFQVVCGAPNAKKDLITVYAPPGAVIPKNQMKLSSILIADTTFSSPDNLIILTP